MSLSPESEQRLKSINTGQPIECTVPLSVESHREIYCVAVYSKVEAESQIAKTILDNHDDLRRANPSAANGADLNNFYAMYRNLAEGWQKQFGEVKAYTLEHPYGIMVSREELVQTFCTAVSTAGLVPETLYLDFRRVTSTPDYPEMCEKLKHAYMHMRTLGYTDYGLII